MKARSAIGPLSGLWLLLASLLLGLVVWLVTAAQREAAMPSLVFAPGLPTAAVFAASPSVIDQLGPGLSWVFASPGERQALVDTLQAQHPGQRVWVLAVPAPLASMVGCSLPMPVAPLAPLAPRV